MTLSHLKKWFKKWCHYFETFKPEAAPLFIVTDEASHGVGRPTWHGPEGVLQPLPTRNHGLHSSGPRGPAVLVTTHVSLAAALPQSSLQMRSSPGQPAFPLCDRPWRHRPS